MTVFETNGYLIDMEALNFIAMPVISLMAVVIYGITLRSSLIQNKIVSSTSLIPYYDEEISQLKEEKKEVGFYEETLDALLNLAKSKSYLEDIIDGELTAGMGLKTLDSKPYNFQLVHLYPIINPESDLNSFYRRVESFIEEINRSQLIASHKNILKRKIRRKVALELFLFRYKMIKNRENLPERLPTRVYEGLAEGDFYVAWKINELEFFQRMERIEKALTIK